MKKPNVGDIVQIHSYKHNGQIHRAWKVVTILEHTADYIIAGNNRTQVIEADGRSWFTREPAICYFTKKHWFNVIGMLRKPGVYFYCNLSSPYLFEEETIKYVDYDLDVKVTPNYDFQILDRDEYERHRRKMCYPKAVEKIIEEELAVLIQMIQNNEGPFQPDFMPYYFRKYKEIIQMKRDRRE